MGLFDRFKKKIDPEVQAQIDRLGSAEARTREAAARALGEMGVRAADAQPALEEALADEDGDVCLAASDALSRIRKEAH
jgi:HEAT repeat protein